MTFATVINAVLVLVCLAVLVQSWRMERRMKAFRETQLAESVVQLDRATTQARTVLGELKKLLATDGLAHATSLSSAEALRDELSVMVGIGNAVAERIMEAAAGTHGDKPAARGSAAKSTGKSTAKSAAKPRRRTTKAKAAEAEAESETGKTKRTASRRTSAQRKPAAAKPAPQSAGEGEGEGDAASLAAPAETAVAPCLVEVAKAPAEASEEAPRKSGEVVALAAQDPRREVTVRKVAAA